MPLSDHGGLVSRIVHDGQQGGARCIKGVVIVAHPILVRVLAGQQRGPGRPADRIAHEGPGEPHPFCGESIDMGGLDQAVVVTADRIGIVVFAGNAYVQLPLTTDYGAAKMFSSVIDFVV